MTFKNHLDLEKVKMDVRSLDFGLKVDLKIKKVRVISKIASRS